MIQASSRRFVKVAPPTVHAGVGNALRQAYAMDREVRSPRPGYCPRCGMKLVPGLPVPVEYPMDFRARPANIPARVDVTLEFRAGEGI